MIAGFSSLATELDQLKKQGLYRTRSVLSSPQGIEIEIDGKRLLNFSSNDYLGLANHPSVIQAFKRATENHGVGSGSAHLICGHSAAHHELENELADFTGRDRVLLFSTGYMANLGVISALLGRGDNVFEDRLNHASLLDGAAMSGARLKRYQHNNIHHLEEKIKSQTTRSLIVSDGVFSMDGDRALLPELVTVAEESKSWLMIDDAHGIGVLGDTGAGVLEQAGLTQQEVPVLMGTLGKSLGTFGAFVAGSETLIETLIQKARTYIYTTALPAAIAEATRTSLKISIAESWRRDKLQQLLARFRQGSEQLGLQLLPTASAIQPIIIGDSQRAVEISQTLIKHGFLVSAIRPPTVPQGEARLRITFSANHQEQHVDQLLEALNAVLL